MDSKQREKLNEALGYSDCLFAKAAELGILSAGTAFDATRASHRSDDLNAVAKVKLLNTLLESAMNRLGEDNEKDI